MAPFPFQGIVAFGDSLTDNGFDGENGFYRATNGKVWVEYLAELCGGLPLDVRAWCGAMSGVGNYNREARNWSGLLWQVDRYQPSPRSGSTLFTIEIGTNDLHDPANGVTPEQVNANMVTAVRRLAALGARYFLLWNTFAELDCPGYSDPASGEYLRYRGKRQTAQRLLGRFNRLLQQSVTRLAAEYPDRWFVFFDFNAAMKRIVPRFANLTTPWLGTYRYPHPGRWLWYDHWHFMTEAHRALAEDIHRLLLDSLATVRPA